MPFPPREKGRVSRPRGSEEEFVLFLQGIPARCRWQELKDLVRQTALHIRQAVVYDDHHGFPTGLGQIIVKNEDEAWRTYNRLSTNGWEGQSLVVTLARTSSPTRPIAGPTKSPSCVIPQSYATGYSTPPRVTQNMAVPASPISPEPVVSTSPTYHGAEYGPVMNPMAIPHQPFMPVFTDQLSQPVPGMPNSPVLRPSFCDPVVFNVLPTYPMSHMHHPTMTNSIRLSHHRPHNGSTHSIPRKTVYSYTSNPLLPTYSSSPPRQPARRTLFIQNLSPATTNRDVKSLLEETGTVELCEVPTDPETDRCKGFARITLRTADEAKRAVALYNNVIFMGSKIRVKIDRSVHTASYSLTPGGTMKTESTADPASSVRRTYQMQPVTTPPPSSYSSSESSDSDEQKQQQHTACEKDDPPSPKVIDRCQPLVVNGSGIGRQAAVAT